MVQTMRADAAADIAAIATAAATGFTASLVLLQCRCPVAFLLSCLLKTLAGMLPVTSLRLNASLKRTS